MRTATVADLRNNFRRVSAWIENGETVEIVKRGKPVAHLTPVKPKGKPVKVNFRAQLRKVWGDRFFTDAEIQAVQDYDLEGQEG